MFDSEEKGSRFILRKTFLSKLLRSKRTARHGLDLVTWKSTHEPTRKPSILAVGIQSSQIGPNVLSGLFQMQLPRNLLLNDFPLCQSFISSNSTHIPDFLAICLELRKVFLIKTLTTMILFQIDIIHQKPSLGNMHFFPHCILNWFLNQLAHIAEYRTGYV